MKDIELELIRILTKHPNLTAAALSEHLKVSPRSVKNYVRSINEQYPGTINSSRTGYEINIENAALILNAPISSIPQNSKERIIYIATKLINLGLEKEIDIYDLSEEIFVSISTLRKDISKVKNMLNKYDLELVCRGDILKIQGTEKNKRKMLSTIIYQESSSNFVNLRSIQNVFPDIDIAFIKNTILKAFTDFHYFINDYSLLNLILHIAISVDRIQHNNISQFSGEKNTVLKEHEYLLAKKISRELEINFQIEFTEAEILDLAILLISRATSVNYTDVTMQNLASYIGNDCMELVNDIAEHINSSYYININESEFLVRFALHLKNLLIRSRHNTFSKNPLTEEIKTTCPLIYDIAVYSAKLIYDSMGILINDDEIAYIAFHLGSILEQQKKLHSLITAVLYCPDYYNMSLEISSRISAYFSEKLFITTLVTDEDMLEQICDIDLIITTLPLSKVPTLPYLQVQFYFSEKDRNNLEEKIRTIQKEKKQEKYKDYLQQLIIPELFTYRKVKDDSKARVIEYMVKKLIQNGYVEKSFKEEVLEREKLSSTAFEDFAIPHSMRMTAKKTAFNVYLNPEGISWDGKRVYLVLMMCFNKNQRHIFNEIYEPITMTLNEKSCIKKIIESQTYDAFIFNLVNCFIWE